MKKLAFLKRENNTTQALWVGLGSFTSFALVILVAAILSRLLNKQDYGTYRQILFVYGALLVIFSAGLPRVFSYFLPRYSLEEGRDIVKKISKLMFFFGAVFSSFLYLFSELIANALNNPELSHGLKIFSPIPMLILPTLGIDGIFSSYRKTLYIAIYNTLTKFITLVFVVTPVLIFGSSYIYSIYGLFAGSLLSLFIALYFKNIPFRGTSPRKTHLGYRELLAYCVPLAIASLWGMASKAADQFYISRYFGTTAFAEFSNGFIELPFVAMVTGAAASVLTPLFSKMHHEGKTKEEIIATWKQALVKSAMLIYPLILFFLFNADRIIEILYTDSYSASAIYFQIAMSINFFNIIIFAPLLFSIGKTAIYSKLHMYFAISSWVTGLLIVQLFNSPIAIAVSSAILSIIKILFFLFYISHVYQVSVTWLIPGRGLLRLATHSFSVAALVYLFFEFIPTDQINNVTLVILHLTCFMLLLLSTGRFLKTDYLSAIKPIFSKPG
ncbi:oligosaccharide flippase family protein [Desulfuromonas versatilis]|uniref:oligosaccharide flippase family protein n=1 Tax=Desulfuromonas versatilis TaxID=2802975 RepID=UPI001C84F374|nr:oligosaccharide flippase family protein [Desulfuromonas versatilis]